MRLRHQTKKSAQPPPNLGGVWRSPIYICQFPNPPPPLGTFSAQNDTHFWFFDSNSSENARRVLISDTMYLFRCLNTFLPILKIFDPSVLSYDLITLGKYLDFALFFSLKNELF